MESLLGQHDHYELRHRMLDRVAGPDTNVFLVFVEGDTLPQPIGSESSILAHWPILAHWSGCVCVCERESQAGEEGGRVPQVGGGYRKMPQRTLVMVRLKPQIPLDVHRDLTCCMPWQVSESLDVFLKQRELPARICSR